MKIERYIQKLILEQESSGWYIKIFGSDTAQGRKADDAAKDAGALRGFFVKAKNFYKANPVNDIAIQQDIVDIIKTQPAVLGPGGVYDDIKYMYVILPLKTLNPKKIKKFYGFIIDRQKVNEFIRVLDIKIKTNAYFKTQPAVSNDEITQLSNIKVYDATQYQNLLTRLSKITTSLNDPVVNSLFDKLKKSLPDTTKFFNLTFDENADKQIVTIDTGGFHGTAYQITVPETGETILIPIEGIQSIKQLYDSPGKGIFYGKFNNKGLPESGEVWYSDTNLNGKTTPFPGYDYVTSDSFGGFIYFNGTLWPTYTGDPLDPGFTFKFKDGEFHFSDGEKYIGTLTEKNQLANGTFYNKDGTVKSIVKNGEETLTPEEIKRRAKAKADAEAKAKADAEAKKKKDAETTKKKEKERVEKIKNKTFKYPFTDARVKELGITSKVYKHENFVYFTTKQSNKEIRNLTITSFEADYKDLSVKTLNGLVPSETQSKKLPAAIKDDLTIPKYKWINPNKSMTLYTVWDKNDKEINPAEISSLKANVTYKFKAQKLKPIAKTLTNLRLLKTYSMPNTTFYLLEFTYKNKVYKKYWVNDNLQIE